MTKAELEWHRAITHAVTALIQCSPVVEGDRAGEIREAMTKLEEEHTALQEFIRGTSSQRVRFDTEHIDGATVCQCAVCRPARDWSGPLRTCKPTDGGETMSDRIGR